MTFDGFGNDRAVRVSGLEIRQWLGDGWAGIIRALEETILDLEDP